MRENESARREEQNENEDEEEEEGKHTVSPDTVTTTTNVSVTMSASWDERESGWARVMGRKRGDGRKKRMRERWWSNDGNR